MKKCCNRLTIDSHLWCAHPNVSIGWANNFLDVDHRGRSIEPVACNNCPLANQQVTQRVPPAGFVAPKRTIVARERRSLECLHRGDELRVVERDVCCGRTAKFKVYQCAIHDECALAQLDGIACCQGCVDFSGADVVARASIAFLILG